MSDFKTKLDEEIQMVQGRFDDLQKTERELKDKRADLDRQIAGNLEEQIRLQGEFRALNKIKEDGGTGGNGKEKETVQ